MLEDRTDNIQKATTYYRTTPNIGRVAETRVQRAAVKEKEHRKMVSINKSKTVG